MNHPRRGHQQELVQLPEPTEMGRLVVRGVTTFARRNKVIAGTYILGWIFLLFVGSGTKLTLSQQQTFNRIMSTIDLEAEYNAETDYLEAKRRYEASRGWFWSCNDSFCQRNKRRYELADRQLKAIRAEGEARMSDAKKAAGVLSEMGVAEAKQTFWEKFYSGKRFATRQSMWDALFIGIRQMSRGRDESWIEYGLKVLFNVLVNFTLGMIMALIFFVFGLWGIVQSYQPNPLIAVLVFVGAASAAFAFVTTYLVAIYGAAAGSVYGVLKVAETTARAQRLNHNQAQQPRMQYYDRPHND